LEEVEIDEAQSIRLDQEYANGREYSEDGQAENKNPYPLG
jgi:hypothetical protein